VDNVRPIVCFGSFQDYLGRTKSGAIKPKNEWVHATNWDCVILDEYHYGAWRENAKGVPVDNILPAGGLQIQRQKLSLLAVQPIGRRADH
jgi:hypothetical protein